MIDNTLRDLLYSFGYLSSVAFTARFLLQWLASEKQSKSVVPKAFWQITLAGNALLCIHAWLQLQFHVCAVSACNGVIAWRNLNLMASKSEQYSLKAVFGVMSAVIFFTVLAFYLSAPEGQWFRVPLTFWKEPLQDPHPLWHLLGTVGLVLFSSRFWVQWWHAEKHLQSELNPLFWWLSLGGGFLSLAYFVHIGDLVNALGPGFGMIPYIRNLMLIYRKRVAVES